MLPLDTRSKQTPIIFYGIWIKKLYILKMSYFSEYQRFEVSAHHPVIGKLIQLTIKQQNM
jgi:hypothetical protein